MFKTSLLCLALLAGAAGVRAEGYALRPSDTQDTVYFRSTAKLEFIEGKTTAIAGGFSFDPEGNAPVSGVLRVDLRELRTGIDTRDRHMRERHLHTEKYPYAYFELTGVEGLTFPLQPGVAQQGRARGYFYIHGGKRPLTADIEVILIDDADGRRLRARATFAIKLDDYEIDRPKALFLKLAETIEVDAIFSGHKDLTAEPIVLPSWPELE
jgi:polyisoprenoid-binding protein YceI